MASPKPTLAERRRLQTRDEISNVAITLFTTAGFEETSMDDVAEAAGVSRRTVYRHFSTKADLVFEHPHRWLERFRSVMDSDPAEESARERCFRGIREVAEIIAADPEPVLASFAVRTANPSLGATHTTSDAAWAELIFANLLAEQGEPDALECMVCAGATIGATNALILAWSLTQPEADLLAMTDATLAQCEGLWPAAPN